MTILSKMSKLVTRSVCECELETGYIFKNFFSFSALRGNSTVTIQSDTIVSKNQTIDEQLYGEATLTGDEINLLWDENIPLINRELHLTFESSQLLAPLSKIKKKERARIIIVHERKETDPDNFCGEDATDEFIIQISCGLGGDGRESMNTVKAIRTVPQTLIINEPEEGKRSFLRIPVKDFGTMMKTFSKVKKEEIVITHWDNKDNYNGLMIKTNLSSNYGAVMEKYGYIPEESDHRRETDDLHQPIEYINDYKFSADKIGNLVKMASMHLEGSVRIFYQERKPLKICYRFGAFGECTLYLRNSYI